MLESERSGGGTIPPSADVKIHTTSVVFVRLVRVLDACVASGHWSDYIEAESMGLHTQWKRMIFCK